jgi:polyhydroxyalkanoate synthase subunit PhaC
MNPLTVPLDLQRHAIEHSAEFMQKATISPKRAARMADVEVGQTSNEVVYSESQFEPRYYNPLTNEQRDVLILIVYALINRPYILDIQGTMLPTAPPSLPN